MFEADAEETVHAVRQKLFLAWLAESFLFIPFLSLFVWRESPFPFPFLLGALSCLLAMCVFRRNEVWQSSLKRVFSLYVKLIACWLFCRIVQSYTMSLRENGIQPAIVVDLYIALLPSLMVALAAFRMAELWLMRKTPLFLAKETVSEHR